MSELGRRELQLMQVLWQHGAQTANDICERLRDSPANATVRTMLRILERKGYVRHAKSGRAFVYRAAVAPKKTLRAMINRLLEAFFDGSPEALVTHMMDERDLSLEALDKICSERTHKKGTRAS